MVFGVSRGVSRAAARPGKSPPYALHARRGTRSGSGALKRRAGAAPRLFVLPFGGT